MKTILLTFLALATSANARLGETIEQCGARFGAVVKRENGFQFYQKGGFLVGLRFIAEKADAVQYSKVQGDALSENEISGILKLYAAKWNPHPDAAKGLGWKSADGKLMAIYIPFANVLFIATEESLARQKAEEAASLKGL